MACPDLNVLTALAEGKGDPEHLVSCPVCREEVDAIRKELAEPAPVGEARSLSLWEALAQGVPLRRRSLLPWAAAAAVLLAAGAWRLSRHPAPPAPAPSRSSASWLVEEGKPWTASRDAQPFVLEGGIPGSAWGGTRLEIRAGQLTVDRGEVLLRIPEGLSLGPRLPAGEVWIGAEPKAADLIRDAQAAEPCRIWTASSKEPEPPHLRALRAALPAPGRPAREGLISVRLRRPPASSEVLLAFPQLGGSRAWLLGDWTGRAYPDPATFAVAYGPWGARGYVEGRKVWSLDAAGAAALPKPPAGVEAGLSSKGGTVEVLRSESWGAPE